MAPTPAPRVAYYLRATTRPYDQLRSYRELHAQQAACEAYCAEHGWPLGTVYQDENGTSDYRPGYLLLLADLAADTYDVLLAFNLDRLARRPRDVAFLATVLAEHGVTLLVPGLRPEQVAAYLDTQLRPRDAARRETARARTCSHPNAPHGTHELPLTRCPDCNGIVLDVLPSFPPCKVPGCDADMQSFMCPDSHRTLCLDHCGHDH